MVLHFTGVYYRELVLGLALSIVVNSAANLPIYYARGSSFRGEVRASLQNFRSKKWFKGKSVETLEMSATKRFSKNETSSSHS